MLNNGSQNEPNLNISGAFTWKPPAGKAGSPTLLAGRCMHCNETFFPRLNICPRCLEALETITLGNIGILYTYTIVHVAPRGFTGPYAIGYVDLPEGVRLFAQLDVQDFAILRPGLNMMAGWGQIRVDEQGQPVYSYTFRPAAIAERVEQQEVSGS